MEAEAETLLLQALEERENKPELADTILPNVPNEGMAAFEAEPVEPLPDADHGEQQQFHEVADEIRSSSNSTKKKLVGLTNAMRLLQKDRTADTLNVDEKVGDIQNPEKQDIQARDDSNSFLNHANILFRRSSATQGKKETSSNEEVQETSSRENDLEEGESNTASNSNSQTKGKKKNPTLRAKDAMKEARVGITAELTTWHDFVEPKKSNAWKYVKWLTCALMLPLLIIAAILFYSGNPTVRDTDTSVSWVCLFILRNLVTASLAKATEVVIIDYCSLRRRFTVNLFGPHFALLVVQSKGWPALSFWWAIWSITLLSGYGDFQKHWLFYQKAIKLFNSSNPAGVVTESVVWISILGSALLFGASVSLKRLWLGLQLGIRAYTAYGEKLATTIEKMLLVSEVATLSRRRPREIHESEAALELNMSFDTIDGSGQNPSLAASASTGRRSSMKGSMLYKSMGSSNKQLILQMLEQWEEPVRATSNKTDASVAAVLQFRQSLSLIDDRFLFGVAFGPTTNRECCIQSGQSVYERLFARQGSDDVLHFDSIAEIAVCKDGTLNRPKLKALVRMFRPARDGELTMIDFLKSVDSVYKEFRVLQASIENAGTVDRAFELMVNWVFYIILWTIILYIVGLDPLGMFLSISSFIIGFAFMIGNASSKYFEGLLFILVRRPYDIGDRISVSDPENDTSSNGSMTWFVEDLGLYSTTVRLAATNEVATYSNGSLANSRIINANRSPQAVVSVLCKFSVNVSYAKVQLFKKATEKFVKERPREWVVLLGFRATRCEPDLGFIEYIVVLQHRESWQNIGAILTSKADLTSFTLELSKQLGMRYHAPPLPVTLKMAGQDGGDNRTLASDFDQSNDLRAMFFSSGAAGMGDTDD
jgi:hypothetical protein